MSGDFSPNFLDLTTMTSVKYVNTSDKKWMVTIAGCALLIPSAKNEILIASENLLKYYSFNSRYPHFVLHFDSDICNVMAKSILIVEQKSGSIPRNWTKSSRCTLSH